MTKAAAMPIASRTNEVSIPKVMSIARAAREWKFAVHPPEQELPLDNANGNEQAEENCHSHRIAVEVIEESGEEDET